MSAANPFAGAQRRVATVALVVADYDEAADWYVQKLGFALVEDVDGHVDRSPGGRTRRWQVAAGPTGHTRLVRVRVLDPGARRYGGRVELSTIVRLP